MVAGTSVTFVQQPFREAWRNGKAGEKTHIPQRQQAKPETETARKRLE
jgi:hypothetical protein